MYAVQVLNNFPPVVINQGGQAFVRYSRALLQVSSLEKMDSQSIHSQASDNC